MLLSHDTLKNHYEINFAMVQHHKYSLTELENMIPWERQLFIDLLAKHVREEQEKLRDNLAIARRNR
jgi:hypothetical protein